jgi:hypothetical protein
VDELAALALDRDVPMAMLADLIAHFGEAA